MVALFFSGEYKERLANSITVPRSVERIAPRAVIEASVDKLVMFS